VFFDILKIGTILGVKRGAALLARD